MGVLCGSANSCVSRTKVTRSDGGCVPPCNDTHSLSNPAFSRHSVCSIDYKRNRCAPPCNSSSSGAVDGGNVTDPFLRAGTIDISRSDRRPSTGGGNGRHLLAAGSVAGGSTEHAKLLPTASTDRSKPLLVHAPAEVAQSAHDQQNLQRDMDSQRLPGSFPGTLQSLSARAVRVVMRVDAIIRKCEGRDAELPSEEEKAMYVVLAALRSSSVGPLFLSHPEVSLSIRSSVICIPELHQDEVINGYCLRAAYNAGTIGRSYFSTRDSAAESSRTTSTSGSNGFPAHNASKDPVFHILKVISFVLRRPLLEDITAEQRVLVNILHQNVLRIVDVLNDETQENMIVITKYYPKGNISKYAGRLLHDPEKLRRIFTEVCMGLRTLHSHKVYHHNLKPDNVLENSDGHFCISDAGFWRLFAVQCPEDLVFNGEIACLPPEVFDPAGPYAAGKVDVVCEDGVSGAAAVDIWGFGVLMYRLAYGSDPIEIAECSYAQVHERLLGCELHFPQRSQWGFTNDLEEAIRWCLQKEPLLRPTVAQLLQHSFFKRGLMIGASPLIRNMSMTSSFGDQTASTLLQRGGSVSSVAAPAFRTQQRNGFYVDAFLGEGRFSETMLVHLRRSPSKQLAFKIIYRSILKRLQVPGREAWAREMRRQLVFSRKVDHPNILRFIDIVEDKRVNCFALQEYMPNGAIHAIPPVTSDKPMPTLQRFLMDVLSGLVHLHDNGLAHLSLAPANIFFSQHAFTYCIADFGPLFVTEDTLADSITAGTPLYALPLWVQRRLPLHGPSVDMFCVGLLGASVLPELFSTVWSELRGGERHGTFSVEPVLTTVRRSAAGLPPALVSFIEDALEGQFTDARAALKHPYFENVQWIQHLPRTMVEVTEEELQNAVHSKPETRDEARMLDVLAHDPFQESQVPNVAGDPVLQVADTSADTSVIPGVIGDKPTVLSFQGENLLCGQCGAELTVALYRCSECDAYVRCGKCSVGDHHKDGHELVPLLIHTIEHTKKGTNKAVLVLPSTVPDVHALETLEMIANFPIGSLTAHLVAQRAAERWNAVRSGSKAGILADIESVIHLPDDVSEQSLSVINGHSSMSFRGLRGVSGGGLSLGCSDNNITIHGGSLSFGRIDLMSPKDAGLPSLLLPSKVSLMKTKNAKKLALAKAEEFEDDSNWQQELERCRSTNHFELLLYNYGLDEVPSEVYTPPLLQLSLLDVSQNHLTLLPGELSLLVHLRKLVVSYNKLTYLPDSLGNLSALEHLDASHNCLSYLPQTFVYLSSLVSAALDYNNFSSIPESLLNILPLPLGSSTSNLENLLGVTTPQSTSRLAGSVSNLTLSVGGTSGSTSRMAIVSPNLKVIYLAANDHLTTFPSQSLLRRFDDLTIALDNEPSLYKHYYDLHLDTELPNITVNWNKLYPDEIVPHLYCGSLRSAQSQIVYRKLNITYLLTVGRQLVPVPPEGGHHKVIVVDDIPGADIRTSFREAVSFIDESQSRQSGCLVHCFAGLSRSATTVIAYLMMKRGMRLDEAYLVTKKGRPAILPNKGFFDQLVALDNELYPEPKRPLDFESLERPTN